MDIENQAKLYSVSSPSKNVTITSPPGCPGSTLVITAGGNQVKLEPGESVQVVRLGLDEDAGE